MGWDVLKKSWHQSPNYERHGDPVGGGYKLSDSLCYRLRLKLLRNARGNLGPKPLGLKTRRVFELADFVVSWKPWEKGENSRICGSLIFDTTLANSPWSLKFLGLRAGKVCEIQMFEVGNGESLGDLMFFFGEQRCLKCLNSNIDIRIIHKLVTLLGTERTYPLLKAVLSRWFSSSPRWDMWCFFWRYIGRSCCVTSPSKGRTWCQMDFFPTFQIYWIMLNSNSSMATTKGCLFPSEKKKTWSWITIL